MRLERDVHTQGFVHLCFYERIQTNVLKLKKDETIY